MKVRDYFVQGRRGWVRLHEKGGKEHAVPCHHSLEQYLDEYIAAAGLTGDPDAPLFQTAVGKTGALTGKALWQQDAYRMIQRRTRGTGIKTRIGNHTFRATGITAYLKNKGTLEAAQHIANHESPRTTKLYDRPPMPLAPDPPAQWVHVRRQWPGHWFGSRRPSGKWAEPRGCLHRALEHGLLGARGHRDSPERAELPPDNPD